MAQEIRLPKLGDTMEEAAVVACRVKPGDQVQRGAVVFDIETDKAAMELESPAEGFVKAILVEVGQTVPVGTALLVLGEKDEQIPQNYKPAAAHEPPAPSPRPPATNDQQRAASNEQPVYKLGQKIPATPLQKDIAEKMLQSKREIPCFYLSLRVDVTELVAFREKLNHGSDAKVSFNDLIMQAMAKALNQFPIMTGQLSGEYIELADSIGIGLAIALPDGYVAPVLKDVDKKNIRQIAAASKTLIEKAKRVAQPPSAVNFSSFNEQPATSNQQPVGGLSSADFEGGCITLSNLGAFGVESFIPIVIPGQCSILGAGKIMDTCVLIQNVPAVRKMMSLTLSVDHKVANGAYAAQFIEYIKKLLEDTTTFS
jgi:pyruvate dehydrogenase E2 component (dihydrolipoamide acetyltransferase)